jgi:hypothetical protein
MPPSRRWLFVFLVLGIYFLAFWFPVYQVDDGFGAFDVAWRECLGFFEGDNDVTGLIGFLPHPLFWFGVFLLGVKQWRAASGIGVAALLASLRWIFEWRYLHIGFFLWLVSMVFLVLFGGLLQQHIREEEPDPHLEGLRPL